MQKLEYTKEQVELLKKRVKQGKSNPVDFCKYWLWTFDPRVKPSTLPFVPFPFQEKLIEEVRHAIEYGEDIFVDKSRDVGATYTILAVFTWFWLYVPDTNFLLGSRKEEYVDNRFGNSDNVKSTKEESLFGKIEFFINHLPPFMLPKGFNAKKNFAFMKLYNPENGNSISGESSNPNFSRGSRRTAILMDEFAFWENDTSAWGSTADTSNCRIILTTPGIKPGKAKRLRFGKDGEKIKIIEIDSTQDPRKDANWEARERERRSTDDFNREIKRNWNTALVGIVYPEILQVRMGAFPYNPSWPLYVAWDFGLDGTAIQWWQPDEITGRKRLVQAYATENQPIQFFLPLFGKDIDSKFSYSELDLALIAGVRNWKPAIHYGDPDVEKRAYQTVDKISTRKVLQDNGIYVQTNTISNSFYERLQATRLMLRSGVDVNENILTNRWIEAMQEARFPQKTETSQSTNEITKPIHNWTSHPRTATEYFAINYKAPVIVDNRPIIVKTNYDPYDK
jgi:hypothetical protein